MEPMVNKTAFEEPQLKIYKQVSGNAINTTAQLSTHKPPGWVMTGVVVVLFMLFVVCDTCVGNSRSIIAVG